MSASEIKNEFENNRDSAPAMEISAGAVIGVLNKACGGDDNRRMIIKFLTGKTSSRQLSHGELYALYCIVQPTKPPGGKWTTLRGEYELSLMCGTILRACVDQPGKTKMDV